MAQDLTQGLTLVDANSNLYMDDQGNFMNLSPESAPAANQFAWGEGGLAALGGVTPQGSIDPFLSIQEQYLGGAPITADNWQDAVRQSLQGFMRVGYQDPQGRVIDPIYNWMSQSGGADSQYKLGTLQDLANTLGEDFFNTGYTSRPVTTHVGNVPIGTEYLDAKGNVVGHTVNKNLQQDLINYFGAGNENASQATVDRLIGGLGGTSGMPFDPLAGLNPEDKLLLFENVPTGSALEQAVGSIPGFVKSGTNQDFNDFIFKLNLDKYKAPAELTKAAPEQVLSQFMNTPLYNLAFGDQMQGLTSDQQLEMMRNPLARFQASPGYQFQQDEAMKQINQQAASRGLLDSSSQQRSLLDRSQNLANQEFSNFMGQQVGTFQDWQNQLKGLQAQGAGISQNLGNQANAVGSNVGNIANTLGSNLASLFANQGSTGAGLISNTGAAQASNLMSAANIQAQIAAANAASGGGGKGGGMLGQLGAGLGNAAGSAIFGGMF